MVCVSRFKMSIILLEASDKHTWLARKYLLWQSAPELSAELFAHCLLLSFIQKVLCEHRKLI